MIEEKASNEAAAPRWKHGVYSQETKAILRESRRRWAELLALLSN